MSGVILPPVLPFRETPNQSDRIPEKRKPTLIVVHAWGNRPARSASEARDLFDGNVNFMLSPASQVSAHVVYGGTLGRDSGQAVQLVRWERKAWTQADVNSAALSIESADAIWRGNWRGGDPDGFAQLARIVAFLCLKTNIPPAWATTPDTVGVCRHLDLGTLGNPDHHVCPTADMRLWRTFMATVREEHRRGGFRSRWGRGVWRPL